MLGQTIHSIKGGFGRCIASSAARWTNGGGRRAGSGDRKKKGMAGRLCIIFGSGDSGFFSKNAAPPWWAVSFPPPCNHTRGRQAIIFAGGVHTYEFVLKKRGGGCDQEKKEHLSI